VSSLPANLKPDPVPPLALFHQHGFDCWGIDKSEGQLARARQFCEERGMKMHFSRGDMRRIPFEDDSFDYVYEHYSMCHMSKQDTAEEVTLERWMELYEEVVKNRACGRASRSAAAPAGRKLRHHSEEVGMRSKQILLAVLVMSAIMICCLSCGEKAGEKGAAGEGGAETAAGPDTVSGKLLVAHIQAHFDDLHDVTMRFHHQDPTLNGMVEIKTMWENGLLKTAEVVANETGSDDLADALVEKMQAWEIEGLDGPFETVIPVNVKLIGLDDPKFPNTATLTGEIRDAEGNPVEGVMVVIKPEVAGGVFRAQTNREGIFVRTLIPPGTWDVEYSRQGYETARTEGIRLAAGKHVRESVVLGKR
jgi:uncharacterized protein (UPF0147 family)